MAVGWGQVSVPKQWLLWELMNEYSLSVLVSTVSRSCLPRRPLRPASGSGPDPSGVAALAWAPVCVKPCVCSPRVESLFPHIVQYAIKSWLLTKLQWVYMALKPHWLSKSNALGTPLPNAWPHPRLCSLTWSSGLSLLGENLWVLIIYQFGGGLPRGRYGIWLYHESIPTFWL